MDRASLGADRDADSRSIEYGGIEIAKDDPGGGIDRSPVPTAHNSSQEQEAIDHLRACWETWATEDYELWAQTCKLDQSGSYWSSGELAPNTMATAEGYLRAIAIRNLEDRDVVAWDIRPMYVSTWGDVVGVYFYGIVHFSDSDGNVTVVQDRRFEVLRKTNGRWGVVGGMAIVDPPGS